SGVSPIRAWTATTARCPCGRLLDRTMEMHGLYVLLQIYPPEAADHEDSCCCLDVIAVDASEAELERYLTAYEPCTGGGPGIRRWDDLSADWGREHGRMLEEVAVKHGVFGALMEGTRFSGPLVPARASVGP